MLAGKPTIICMLYVCVHVCTGRICVNIYNNIIIPNNFASLVNRLFPSLLRCSSSFSFFSSSSSASSSVLLHLLRSNTMDSSTARAGLLATATTTTILALSCLVLFFRWGYLEAKYMCLSKRRHHHHHHHHHHHNQNHNLFVLNDFLKYRTYRYIHIITFFKYHPVSVFLVIFCLLGTVEPLPTTRFRPINAVLHGGLSCTFPPLLGFFRSVKGKAGHVFFGRKTLGFNSLDRFF